MYQLTAVFIRARISLCLYLARIRLLTLALASTWYLPSYFLTHTLVHISDKRNGTPIAFPPLAGGRLDSTERQSPGRILNELFNGLS